MISDEDLFESLVGHEHDFYGVDNNVFCIGVEGSRCAFEVLEDESDGYRSYFDTIMVSMKKHIFFYAPLARVILERSSKSPIVDEYTRNSFDGWQLRDVKDDHVWLLFGTDRSDDYYPRFTFDYNPKRAEEFLPEFPKFEYDVKVPKRCKN